MGLLVDGLFCHTEFAATGPSFMVWVWKLKGALELGGGPGELRVGVGNPEDDLAGLPHWPNVSLMGDNVFESYDTCDCSVCDAIPPMPRPYSGSSGIGVGGVGVLGGAGMGRSDAMTAIYMVRYIMR